MEIFFERVFEEILFEFKQNELVSIVTLSTIISFILSTIQLKLGNYLLDIKQVKEKVDYEIKQKSDLDKKEKHFYTKSIYKKYGYSPIFNFIYILPLTISLLFLVPIYYLFKSINFGEYFSVNLNEPLMFNVLNMGVIFMTIISMALNFFDNSLNKDEKKFNYILSIIFLVVLYQEKLSLIIFWTFIQLISYPIKITLNKSNLKIGTLIICLMPYFVLSINTFFSFISAIAFLLGLNFLEKKLLNRNFYLKQLAYIMLVFIFYSSIFFEFLMYINQTFNFDINIPYKGAIFFLIILTFIILLFKSTLFDLRPLIIIFSIITFFGKINSLENYKFKSKEFSGVTKNEKPILLIFLDGFQSPKVIKEKFNYENYNFLTNYLRENNWQVVDEIKVNEILTWNSMVNTFNYNLTNDSVFNNIKYKSTLFKKDQNFILKKSQLFKDLKDKNLKIKSYGLTPFNYLYKSPNIEHLMGRKEVFSSLNYYNQKLSFLHDNRFIYSILSNSILNIAARLTFFLKARHDTFLYFKDEYIKGYDFVNFHFHMPHAPHYFKDEFEPENLWSFDTSDYIKFWDFSQRKMVKLLKSIDYSNYRVILASDHGDDEWGGIYTTFVSFYGFDNNDIKKVKTIHDLGILINSSYKQKL